MIADSIKQGETYYFTQTLDGEDIEEFTYHLNVKQYPGDGSSINKPLDTIVGAEVSGVLTAQETSQLDVGLWYLIITSTDPDETICGTRRLEVRKSWV